MMLDGEESAYKDMVIANAAAAFYVAGKVRNFKNGAELARGLIESGEAKNKLNELIRVSNYVWYNQGFVFRIIIDNP